MINIDYRKDKLLTEFSLKTLGDRYLVGDEQSPQEGFARAAQAFADDEAHAQRLYDYASNLWFMFATPVLSNGGTQRGLPISCFLNYVDDSREGITGHYTENAYLSSFGGGIGGSWSDVRAAGTKTSKGSESTGVMPFVKVVDAEMLAFSQGVTRRGSYASYLHISHPEIEEFLDMRKPTGGDTNRKCLNLHHGVVIPDKFMEIIHKATKEPGFDDSWELIDPHSGEVKSVVSARTLWVKLLQNRMESGEPYLMYEDAVNADLPQFQKDKGMRVHHSNLCSEITLATNDERTAVCCLSSVNLEYYDEWKKVPAFIPDLIRMLDNVLESFIQNAPPQLERAQFSAMRERSLGLGAMGFHAYLQKNGISFESPMASAINYEMFSSIKSQAQKTTEQLAVERGACPDDDSCSVRNAHLLAVAPNASSSIICGNTSPSIEPYRANAYTQKTKSGSYLQKNKFLEKVLEKYESNDDNTWKSIVTNKGSVQHLEFLSEEEKEVFKTAVEINQSWVIEHAAQRQEFICQSQSVNLFFPPDVNKGELHNIHMLAWAKNMKTLYYLRSEAISRADNVSNKIKREIIFEQQDCLSCEG
ncbi:MAG: ribonucleotide-diphosphate reductase subunit alpha [Candidatus Pelagibacter sp.]|nr:ribonucleotide-diphosphate reductase subunit alpha [Candidatus Pelagibacter sp.]MAJ58197.1 ribonucleotide-diphosphate reductase subunit alpha [Candidatus Pelagibacter sp.]|tara:strand:+ start:3271 stop:5034 length:1764 start_codon:yes stop_codon:yes gene_type:complete